MGLLNIVTIPNPKLKKPSEDINKDKIKELKPLIKNMLETMYVSDGIGLAAVQIGKNINLAVIGKEATPDNKDMVLINPKIIGHSWRKVVAEEGCLSVPGITQKVPRFAKIKVKALNQEGQLLNFDATDFLARVIQHEIDHLQGTLITDYV